MQVGRQQHLLPVPLRGQRPEQLQAPLHHLAGQPRSFPGPRLQRPIRPPRAHVHERAERGGVLLADQPRRRDPQPTGHPHEHLVPVRPGQQLRERHPGPHPLQQQRGGVPHALAAVQHRRATTLPGPHPCGLVARLLMSPRDLQHQLGPVPVPDRCHPGAGPAGDERGRGLQLPAREKIVHLGRQPLPPGDELRILPLPQQRRHRVPGYQRARGVRHDLSSENSGSSTRGGEGRLRTLRSAAGPVGR